MQLLKSQIHECYSLCYNMGMRTCSECGKNIGHRGTRALTCAGACRQKRARRIRSETLNCLQCGREITGRKRLFCDATCRSNHAREHREAKYGAMVCATCSKPLEGRTRKYCDAVCRNANRPRYDDPGRRWRGYGLSDDDFKHMEQRANGHCELCGRRFTKTPHIDHDHRTGRVRGLLCSACNTGLGRFDDDPERLRAAIQYLTRV